MGSKKLLAKTENAYKQVWQLFKDHREDEYFHLIGKKEIETSQAEYSSKIDLEETLNSYLKPFADPSYDLQPLNDYKLVLYGKKLVCLELISLDKKLRGKSALWIQFKNENGNKIAHFRKLYFHIPKSKTNFEIIR